MAENSWPFYGDETNETQFSKWARALADSGIASGLNITAGGGMSVNLSTGSALVRGLFYENTTTLNKVHLAAPSVAGQTRLDAYILSLNQDLNKISFEVRPGNTDTSGGALPALAQNETIFDFLIGSAAITQGTAAVTSAMIVENRPTPGNRILVNTNTRRPAASAVSGYLFFNTTTSQLEYSNGSIWTALITAANLSGIVPASKGGTGVQTMKALRDLLDIRVQTTDPGHKKGRIWINGPALD